MMPIKFFATLTTVAIILFFPTAAFSQNLKTSEDFGQHTVHFSVFNTTSLTPEIAKLYNTVRSKDRILVNIAMVANDNILQGGRPAQVSGTVTNLIAQQQVLNFQTVKEGEVHYYIAEARITNEDILRFNIDVTPEGAEQTYTVEFVKKVYFNE